MMDRRTDKPILPPARPGNSGASRTIGSLPRTAVGIGLILLLLILLPAAASAADLPWGPWSVNDDAPVLMMKADRRTARPVEKPAPTVAATPFLWLLSFYQTAIGPTVSGRCPMYPTCSQYSVEAVRKHGPAIGIVMTADRLIHEMDEQKYAPLVKVGGRYRFSDPVRNNDFWWYHE